MKFQGHASFLKEISCKLKSRDVSVSRDWLLNGAGQAGGCTCLLVHVEEAVTQGLRCSVALLRLVHQKLDYEVE